MEAQHRSESPDVASVSLKTLISRRQLSLDLWRGSMGLLRAHFGKPQAQPYIVLSGGGKGAR